MLAREKVTTRKRSRRTLRRNSYELNTTPETPTRLWPLQVCPASFVKVDDDIGERCRLSEGATMRKKVADITVGYEEIYQLPQPKYQAPACPVDSVIASQHPNTLLSRSA